MRPAHWRHGVFDLAKTSHGPPTALKPSAGPPIPGPPRAPAARARGDDHHAKIELELLDAFNGAEPNINPRGARLNDTGHVVTWSRGHVVTWSRRSARSAPSSPRACRRPADPPRRPTRSRWLTPLPGLPARRQGLPVARPPDKGSFLLELWIKTAPQLRMVTACYEFRNNFRNGRPAAILPHGRNQKAAGVPIPRYARSPSAPARHRASGPDTPAAIPRRQRQPPKSRAPRTGVIQRRRAIRIWNACCAPLGVV